MEQKKQLGGPSEFRNPPADYESEESVLGAMLMSREAIDTAVEIVEGSDFYREANRKVFNAIVKLHEKKEPADMMTLKNELKGEYEAIGGIATLSRLIERCPTAANVEYYAQIVKEKSEVRKLISAATQIVADAYADIEPIAEQMDKAEFRILEATEKKVKKGFVLIKDIIGKVFEEVSQTIGNENHVTGLPMGIGRLDLLTRGLCPGKLYIIGARPGVGKTALSINMLWNVASGNNPTGTKIPVGLFSIEMTEIEIGQRLLCSVAKVDYNAAKENRILDKERTALSRASARIYETPIYIDDSSAPTIMELKAGARRLKKNHDIQLLVVDYLQLIRAGIKKDNREQEISYISMNLKALAKDLNIPIVVASQLTRPMKGTEAKPPVLSDLRESGAIEQDANVVIFIHKWKTKEERMKHGLILAKNRNGATDDDIPIHFQEWQTTFMDIDAQAVQQ